MKHITVIKLSNETGEKIKACFAAHRFGTGWTVSEKDDSQGFFVIDGEGTVGVFNWSEIVEQLNQN